MKDIKNYERLYAVTEDGQVWSYRRKIFLKPNRVNGYLRIALSKDNKRKDFFIHRLAMGTYYPIENMDKLQINHIDGNKENNCLSNLEWCDAKYNNNYGTHNKRSATKRSKKVLCIETKVIHPSISEASRQTGIAIVSISKCCNGKQRIACGFHWEFVD